MSSLFAVLGLSVFSTQTLSADLHLTHVTPFGFTAFWEGSDEPVLEVFLDDSATTEVTQLLRRESYPLAVPFLRTALRQADREYRALLTEASQARSLVAVRVTGAQPDTTYFVRVAGTSGLIPVRTALRTGFVRESRQMLISFPESAVGSVALLEVAGTRAPLYAVVGDGAGPGEARFDLDHLIDDDSGETWQPSGLVSLQIHWFPGLDPRQAATADVAYLGSFTVAGAIPRAFLLGPGGPVFRFAFEPVADQWAGQPFMVTLRALDEAGNLVTAFSGNVRLTSTGRLEQGSDGGNFVDGIMTGHPVVIGNTGDFTLAATVDGVSASGESNLFAVRTNWQNWLAVHGDPDNPQASLLEEQRFDPTGSGLPQLLRYAFDLSQPGDVPGDATIIETIHTPEGDFLSLRLRRLQYAPDLRYVVYGSSDARNWEILDVIAPGSPEWVTVIDTQPLHLSPSRLMRASVVGGPSYAFWQASSFFVSDIGKTSVSGPGADPGGYGINNLTRYALGMDPYAPDTSLLPTYGSIEVNGDLYQTLSFIRLTEGDDILYRVEASTNLIQWEEVLTLSPGIPAEVVVQDSQPLPSGGNRFLRLRILPKP